MMDEASIDGELGIESCDSEPFFTINGTALYYLLEEAFKKVRIGVGDKVIIVIYKEEG